MANVEHDGNEDAADARAAGRVWRDIVTGRLVIERHCDEGGRRFVYVRSVEAPKAVEKLSPRERQVVGYRSYGQPLKKIAHELGVSVPTVARDLASALGKLGLSSELELPAVFGPGLRAKKRG